MINPSDLTGNRTRVLSTCSAVPQLQQYLLSFWGHAVAQLVEARRYKPEGRGFDFRWCRWNFLSHTSGRTVTLGLKQPLT